MYTIFYLGYLWRPLIFFFSIIDTYMVTCFRIVKYSPCSPECYIIALIYIDRVMQRNQTLVLSSLNVHRLLLTSIMVAVKFCDDSTYNNAYYARVGGIGAAELNRLELDFLRRINWALAVPPPLFHRYHTELLKHNARAALLSPSAPLPPAPAPVDVHAQPDEAHTHMQPRAPPALAGTEPAVMQPRGASPHNSRGGGGGGGSNTSGGLACEPHLAAARPPVSFPVALRVE